MNNDLISREALIASYYKEAEYQDFLEEGDVSHLLWKCIDEAHSVDAVEVVHAKWEYHECVSSCDGTISVYACSNCHFAIDEEPFEQLDSTNYCPNCGARMAGE